MSREISVEWEGPISYDKAIKEFNLDNEERSDFGLYQIYGPHPLYSNRKRQTINNVLLYIGQTTSYSTFSGRINYHGFCHGPEYEIYFGRIDPECKIDDNIWKLDVMDAEKIMINKYAPAYNGTFTGDLRKEQLNSHDCVIIHKGSKADLDKEDKAEDVVYNLIR